MPAWMIVQAFLFLVPHTTESCMFQSGIVGAFHAPGYPVTTAIGIIAQETTATQTSLLCAGLLRIVGTGRPLRVDGQLTIQLFIVIVVV